MKNREHILTDDGSSSFYLPDYDENFHSTHGAIQESKHIFINSGLDYISLQRKKINILEMGLGTGLNAILTFRRTIKKEISVSYTGVDLYPLQKEEISKLNYDDLLNFSESELKVFNELSNCNWDSRILLEKHFEFEKIFSDIKTVNLRSDFYDLVYFDAFNPDIQPDLWSKKVFENIYHSMKNGGVFMTYSVKGIVKRNLKAVGFQIGKLAGPKGKREILRAIKP